MGRLMAKSFDIEGSDKGTGLQSKFNAFTAGKNIGTVHGFEFRAEGGRTKGLLLFEQGEGEPSKEDRIYAKVIEGRALGSSDLQTAVNSWSKDKTGEVKGVATTVDANGNALIVVLHTRGANDSAESNGSAEPAAEKSEQPAEPAVA